jgi:hypothetical protein
MRSDCYRGREALAIAAFDTGRASGYCPESKIEDDMEEDAKKAYVALADGLGLKPWILGEDGRTPVRTDMAGHMEWTHKAGGVSARVALDEVDGARVSTIFIDSFSMVRDDNRMPKLFETLVTDRDGISSVEGRYWTWEEAEQRHAEIVARLTPETGTTSSPKP